MTDPEPIALVAGGTAITAVGAFARWAVRVWATVRREGIEAAKEAAAAARADNERMVHALLESARAQTHLAGRIDQLPEMLELVFTTWREREERTGTGRTPKLESEQIDTAPLRAAARGTRRPRRAGTHGDSND